VWPFVQSWQAQIAPLSTHRVATERKPPLLCVVLTYGLEITRCALDPTQPFGTSAPESKMIRVARISTQPLKE
jgi:hypothetical protein